MSGVSVRSVSEFESIGGQVSLRGTVATFSLGSIAIAGLGAANGGSFPTSWGWATVAFAVVLAWALAVNEPRRPTRVRAPELNPLSPEVPAFRSELGPHGGIPINVGGG